MRLARRLQQASDLAVRSMICIAVSMTLHGCLGDLLSGPTMASYEAWCRVFMGKQMGLTKSSEHCVAPSDTLPVMARLRLHSDLLLAVRGLE